MTVLRDRRVTVLLVLVLLGSALAVVLALTRPAADGATAPPVETAQAPYFVPADLLGPGGEALAAAVSALPAALGYDHRDLDATLTRATQAMTTGYARVFTRTFDRRVRPLAQRQRSVVEARVRGAGVVRTDGDTAVVCLVYVDQVQVRPREGRKDAQPRVLSRNRVRVEMVLRSGAWKINGIDPL
ncbi:hypothetical protein [Nocardioides rubriscoriae]|uniref:hypothetical protein n=1 Tax=Nocardioides rubriscoriae TaxID=642762 RepID=UPI0011DFCD13|nr:hypothetical protein [Nocardioides rubriscoriae]